MRNPRQANDAPCFSALRRRAASASNAAGQPGSYAPISIVFPLPELDDVTFGIKAIAHFESLKRPFLVT